MTRITQKQLEHLVDHLNDITNHSREVWQRNNKSTKANIGTYYIAGAYGGVSLYQICNVGGGIHDILNTGYTTKKDLFNQIHAYIRGIRLEVIK